MNTKLYSILLLGAAAICGCSDNWEPQLEGHGVGHLSVGDINVANGETPKSIRSRAVVSTDNFIVTVKTAEGKEVNSWVYSQMPELIDLPTGSGYTVSVMSHVQEAQAWDMPYYEGESTAFDIVADEITKIGTVTATFSNIAVTINYSDELRTAMESDCKVNVVANHNGTLDFLPTETRTGYFKADAASPTLVAAFTGTVNGEAVQIIKTYSDVVAGNHYYINFGLKAPDPTLPEETGDIYVDPASGISIDMNVEIGNVEGNVDIDEDTLGDGDRPGQEEPETPDPGEDPVDPGVDPGTPGAEAATFSSTTLDFEGVNDPAAAKFDATQGGSAVVDIHCDKGIKNLIVDIASDSESFIASAGEMVPFHFDLADPVVDGVDWSASLGPEGLNFPVGAEVVNATDLQFKITDFVPLLAGFPGNHSFTITVVNNDGNSKAVVLKFHAD